MQVIIFITTCAMVIAILLPDYGKSTIMVTHRGIPPTLFPTGCINTAT